MKEKNNLSDKAITRRYFAKNSALGAMGMLCHPVLSCRNIFTAGKIQAGAAAQTISLDRNWLFGGRFEPSLSRKAPFSTISIPHCVTKLSWQDWKPSLWQDLWIYRRHFSLPESGNGLRAFLHFEGVMVGATPTINGHGLRQHMGGYLPFEYEITDWLKDTGNVLDVLVDSRWSSVPPEGSPLGANRVDYLEPGGIYRSVSLELVPQVFIRDVFAKPVGVLESDRRVEVTCTIDAAIQFDKSVQLQVELREADNVLSRSRETVPLDKKGPKELTLTLSDLKDISLWHVDTPHLYQIVATLLIEGKPIHDYQIRIGFREAKFESDGFFLNGKRLQLFGLNRHELFPYVGGAMPQRVMRRDAEILRREFNCNIVRCSHYPQSTAFLNACDELGLMVWEEVPGWQYLGDETWKELLVRDVKDMVIRDRNHASIIIWGVRVNESPNDPVLYRRTKELAKSLDDSRPTSGSMTADSIKTWKEDWHQDVLAYDDYHADPDGSVGIRRLDAEVPYMLAEAVGQFNYSTGKNFDCIYRRAGDPRVQQLQAIRHAQAHNKAADDRHICGVIAWCAFEYASLINPYKGVKYPGIADVFRIPKLGASFYLSQIDPLVRPVIEPNFYWDFGPRTPDGPGKNVAIFSNCQRLEIFVNRKHCSTSYPDKLNYQNLKYPPFFTDLEMKGSRHPELRIDGYIGNEIIMSRSFSSDKSKDQFLVEADDSRLTGDGADSTRIVFRVADLYGASRLMAGGEVTFKMQGPGILVGDNPFILEESGGAGAVWIKTAQQAQGIIYLTATHSFFGAKNIKISVLPAISMQG